VTDWRALYPFESRWLDVAGHRLHYLDEGPRDAPALLLLHGNPTWSFFWRDVVRALRGQLRVIAADHLGCGLSDKPQDWSYRLADHVANVERLVEALGLGRFSLGVHDWGGAIGMGLATRQPQRVERLVVLNTAAFRSSRLPLRIAACRLPVLGPLGVRGLNAFARAATFMTTEKPLPAAVKAGYLAPYGSWRDRIAVLRFVQDIPMQPGHPSWATLANIEQGLSRLRHKPLLLVWGERDWCFTPAFRDEWQQRFPGAELLRLENAGHYVLEDAGETAIPRIAAFLAHEAP
jgi:pimeloyl-ACP methyl ester carboxylesterase